MSLDPNGDVTPYVEPRDREFVSRPERVNGELVRGGD
jgi:hypothetical protein